MLAGLRVLRDRMSGRAQKSSWACLPAGPLERHDLEGILEGGWRRGPNVRDLQSGWYTYLWKVLNRGSLCLLLDWTSPHPNWLLNLF